MQNLWLTSLVISFFLLPCSNAAETAHLQGLGEVRYHTSIAQEIGREFHIYIMLPEGYDESDARYPTLYLLDGGNLFPMLTPYYRALNFGEGIPDSIIVGISYGSDNFEGGNYRSTDFTAASEEREFWGGAPAFQDYLAEELLPFVEAQYRSDASQRVIFGQSLGGQFVIYTAMTRPSLFWGHIASNPAMHRNIDFFLEPRADYRAAEKSNLFIGDALLDDPRFKEPRDRWITRWYEQPQTTERGPWNLHVEPLDGHTHMSAPPASFRAGMRWLFDRPVE